MNDSIEDQIPVRRPPLFSRPKKLKSVYIYVEYLIGNAGAAMTWPVTSLYLHNYLHQSFFYYWHCFDAGFNCFYDRFLAGWVYV